MSVSVPVSNKSIIEFGLRRILPDLVLTSVFPRGRIERDIIARSNAGVLAAL